MKSIVLLSGGLDSTVALAHTGADLALAFNYGQTHARELDAAINIARYYDIAIHIIDLTGVLRSQSALTGHAPIPDGHADTPDTTLVPGRNLVMLSIATAWANAKGYDNVVIGANADDRAGYPDCRPTFINALDYTARTGYGIGVWAPLLRMTKKQIVALGHVLEAPLHLTWSCYRGGDTPCGTCGACESRDEAMA